MPHPAPAQLSDSSAISFAASRHGFAMGWSWFHVIVFSFLGITVDAIVDQGHASNLAKTLLSAMILLSILAAFLVSGYLTLMPSVRPNRLCLTPEGLSWRFAGRTQAFTWAQITDANPVLKFMGMRGPKPATWQLQIEISANDHPQAIILKAEVLPGKMEQIFGTIQALRSGHRVSEWRNFTATAWDISDPKAYSALPGQFPFDTLT